MPTWIPALVLFVLGLPAAPGVGQAQDRIYVSLQGQAGVAVVDAATFEEVARVDLTELGFSANASPHHTAVDPDGSHWYVSLITENRVVKFDRENRMVGQAELTAPGLMVRDPSGPWLYVARSMMAADPPRSVGRIHTGTMEVEEMDVFFPRPHAVALAPGQDRIFSASLSQNQMGSLQVETLEMGLTNLDGPIHTVVQVAVSPDESTLVATGELTGRLLVFDLTSPDAPQLRHSVEVGSGPWHPVFEPDGARVWMGLKGADQVVAVDVRTGEVVERISHPAFHGPHGALIRPDGRYLFLSSSGPGGMEVGQTLAGGAHHGMHHGDPNHHPDHDHRPDPGHDPAHAHGPEAMDPDGVRSVGTLSVIDLSTAEVVRVLEMGRNTTGIGMRPW